MRRFSIGILMTLVGPAVWAAPAGQPAVRISSAEIDQRVIASLPARQGKSADIVYRFDLTRPFDT